MSWRLEFSKVGERDLSLLDRPIRRDVIDRCAWLALNFESITPIPLHAQWKGFFKLRVGDWRAVYSFSSSTKMISVRLIDHRDRVYKRKN